MTHLSELEKTIFALQLKHQALVFHDTFQMNISPIEGSFDPAVFTVPETMQHDEDDNEDDWDIHPKEVPVNRSFKKAVIEKNPEDFQRYKRERLKDNFLDYDWHRASGLGVMLGYNDIWALDIDNIKYREDSLCPEEDKEWFINKLLHILRLPDDYPWVVESGSGNGLHILFRCQTVNNQKFEQDVIVFVPDNRLRTSNRVSFERMELRMRAFLVLPPSLHLSGGKYKFYKDRNPEYTPMIISADSLYLLLSEYFSHRENIYVDNLYLQRTAIFSKERYEGSDRYGDAVISYKECKDEMYLFESCHVPDAMNSLGVLYAQQAINSKDGKMAKQLFNKAETYFVEANTEDSKRNIQRLKTLGHLPINSSGYDFYFKGAREGSKHFDYVEDELGDYKYEYLKRVHGLKYIFFDTETTGLPTDPNLQFYNDDMDCSNWPRMVQFSWLCTDESGTILDRHDSIIKPSSFVIPKEASNVHGITTEKALREGEELIDVLRQFVHCLRIGPVLVGHNLLFDINVVGEELMRTFMCEWEVFPEEVHALMDCDRICTMESSVDLCKIPGRSGYKYPKLQELHRYLFGSEFSGAHNSMTDVQATMKCFFELKKRKVLKK